MNRLASSSIVIAVSILGSALEAFSNPTLVPTEPELHFSWKDKDGKSLPDTDSRKSKNDFAAQLFMTEDKDLWHQWAVLPSTVAPKITSLNGLLKRNTPVFFAFIYANPRVDEKGYVNVTCDLTITKPDGKVRQVILPRRSDGKESLANHRRIFSLVILRLAMLLRIQTQKVNTLWKDWFVIITVILK